MTSYKYKIHWYCPECKKSGRVFFDDGIDIWCVVDKIIGNHHRMSPDCILWWSYIKLGEQQDVQDTIKENSG
jgi:hypothetical protein